MGLYLYEHPKTKKVIELVQGMNETHEYTDEKGIKWNRVWINPQASIDTKLDVWSPADFAKKTANKKGTIDDLWSEAGAASMKRMGNSSFDPLKEEHYKNYSAKRSGAIHEDVKKRVLNEKLKKAGVKITE